MKKAKFLTLALVVAIMMMGAGYALWSDQVFLNTTVRTGKFDMVITNASTRSGDDQLRNKKHDWHQYDWTHTVYVNHNSNNATVEFKDLYPGGTVRVSMTIRNDGTIPARLDSIDVKQLNDNPDLFNLLRAKTNWKADINGDGEQEDMSKYGWGHVEWDRKEWRYLQGALNAFVKHLNDNNVVIEPGGHLLFESDIKLDPEAGNDLQNKNCKFELTFNWEQWASDPTQNPYDDGKLPGYGGDGDIEEIQGR